MRGDFVNQCYSHYNMAPQNIPIYYDNLTLLELNIHSVTLMRNQLINFIHRER